MAINKLTMSQMIYEQLKKDIIESRYKPGDQLKEVWVAKKLEVSPTPVREAFKQLEAEGFLENLPYKGVFVKRYREKDFRMAYMVRARMEGLALRLIMEDITEEESKILDEIMTKSLENSEERAMVRFYPFHDWIIRNTRTDIIIKTLTSINGIINVNIIMKKMCHREEQVYCDNHEVLYDLIRKKDIDGAEKQLESMIVNQMNFVE
ncbi:MAG: GntR family transcriptional regulator [Clostridia bacterium]|nr:GntR family transcriptional regulator [Clostridia bacterium]